MVKRCIGIDIGFSHLRAVQVSRTDDGFHIEKTYDAQTRRNTDSASDILKTLTSRHGFDGRAAVAVSVPYNSVFFRSREADSAVAERASVLDSSALEHDFPIQPDETVAQMCSYSLLPGEKYSVLTSAVSKDSLNEKLNVLAKAKLRPDLVDTAIFAIHSVIMVNHPEIMTGQAVIAYVDEAYFTLAVTENSKILIVRNIPIVHHSDNDVDLVREQVAEILSREVEISWRKVFRREIEEDTKIYLVNGDNAFDGIETLIEGNMSCQTVIVNPYAKVKCSAEHNDDSTMCIAEGLAVRALTPEETTGVNFLDADNADTKPALNLKKELIICATLIGAIVVVLLAGLFVQLARLEAKHAGIKSEIRETFQRILPEEKNIVNPPVQLKQKLQTLRADYMLFGSTSGVVVGPLEVLYAVNNSMPSGASIDSMLITTESVRLAGTFQSFESVYSWQRLLQQDPQFSAVDVRDIHREPNSKKVRFTILASLAERE
jgi:Tfp pilus assembly PilM family ATPase/Tfp pilus assembly protein PilN